MIIPLAIVMATGMPNTNGPENSDIVTIINAYLRGMESEATAVAITVQPSFIPFVTENESISIIVIIRISCIKCYLPAIPHRVPIRLTAYSTERCYILLLFNRFL